MECLTSKYAAMKLLSFYIHIKNAIIDKILRRAELQFNYCAAGDDDPTTMQIKRACKEFKPTDTFPESFYSSIVSKIILHLDTHIDIKLRNGQTL